MDVVALVQGRNHASTRYRIAQFSEHLRAQGLTLRLEPIASRTPDRIRQLTRRRSEQIVFLQRKLLPVWQLWLLRKSTPFLVYDFDDAVFSRDSFHPRGPYSLTRLMRFHATAAAADYVIAGNSYLASHAARCTKANRVRVIPTCVNARQYKPADHEDRRPTRLVWIGSSSTLASFRSARSIFEEIGRQLPNTKLRVICDSFPSFEHLPVERSRWSPASESSDLRESDIGISWLTNDSWSRGKCGLKVLQYMAAGLPVVASPVGVHAEILSGGLGMLPACERDWIEAVAQLAKDTALRDQIGREARRRIESDFDLERWGPVLADTLREAANRA